MSLRAQVDEFVAVGGYWAPALEPLLESAPDFVRAYLAFAGKPWRSGPLIPKVKALIGLALDAAMTHLHAHGVRRHCRAALRLGAGKAEIIEVLQLVSVLGVHASLLAMPILTEQLSADPERALDLRNGDARRQALKQAFIDKRGYWNHAMWDGLLALDPDYFEAFIDFSGAPWRSAELEPKVKEFIYIAVDISSTHQFAPGTHVHIENALKFGATPAELLEVMQLASAMGIQSFELALPILDEEIALLEQERAAR
jgi:alkylhydroperoxidase/carboxymuconolactone decarboxylase family protein YurZ